MTSPNPDVLIIGAGAAGLAAGRMLALAGKCVTIVEARDRIGGRIYTRHVAIDGDRAAVELGAEFIHGLPPESWSLVHAANLATTERQGQAFCFDGGTLEHCDERQRDGFRVLERMQAWLEQRAPSDLSFQDFLQAAEVDPAGAQRAAAYVEGFNAADRNIISATALMRQQCAEERVQGDRIFHIDAGYDALPAHLAEGLRHAGGRILLGFPVREVRWTQGAVSVFGRTAGGEDFRADAPQAIITLPLGVLKANSVTFDPVPAEIARHCNAMRMGYAERITLEFDRPFWADKAPGLSFLLTPGESIPTWWTRMPEPTPMITGWAGGASVMARWRQAGIAGLPAVERAALQTLSGVFGEEESNLRRWLTRAHHHAWGEDAFSLGAYSYVAANGLEAARRLSAPIEQTLFFAGEHTDLENQWGTVHAALASGIRAARQLLEIPSHRS